MNKPITQSLRQLLVIVSLLLPALSFAYDFEVDGIYYSKTSSNEVKVTHYANNSIDNENAYIGDILIPEKVSYDNNEYYVTSIDSSAFSGCSGLKSVIIPISVTSIGSHAFFCCSRLTSVNIPNSVTEIGKYAFLDCSELTSLEFNATNCTTYGSSDFPIFPSSITSLTIGNNVTSIPDYFLCKGNKIESLTIPNSVRTIGINAFYGCSELKSLEFNATNCITCGSYNNPAFPSSITKLTIGNNVTSIPKGFLYNGSKIESLTIPNSVTKIGDWAFRGCLELKSVTIPTSVISIGYSAFNGCSALTSVSIPNSVKEIGSYAFKDCRLTSLEFNATGCTKFGSLDTWVFPSSITSLTIGKNVTFIPHYFLNDGSQIESLIIPESVTEIGSYAFGYCSKLTSVNIPNSVTDIDSHAFHGCSRLSSVTIPNSVTKIRNHAFDGCSGLTSVSIPNSVTEIDDWVFSGCSGLKSVTIPNSVTEIGLFAFYGCSGLTSVAIPNSVTKIGTDAFYGCSGLKKSAYPNSLSNPFNYGMSIPYPAKDAIIENNVIYDCDKTTIFFVPSDFKGDFEIPNSVTSIGNAAFYACSGLASVSVPSSVTKIGDNAFSGCTRLTKYYSYSIVPPVCGDQALDNINKWECTLYVPKGSINEYKAAPQWKEFFFIDEMDAVLAAEIRLNITDVTLLPEETSQLSAEILPANATDKSLSWSSSDENVATVDSNGLVTAIAAGEATITVRSLDGNAEATCVVTVNPRISGIASISDDSDLTVEVFNMTGLKVADSLDNLAPGIYIVRKGMKTHKIIIK